MTSLQILAVHPVYRACFRCFSRHFWSPYVFEPEFFVFALVRAVIVLHRLGPACFCSGARARVKACFAVFFCANVYDSCVIMFDRGVSRHGTSSICRRSPSKVIDSGEPVIPQKIGFTINTGSKSFDGLAVPSPGPGEGQNVRYL